MKKKKTKQKNIRIKQSCRPDSIQSPEISDEDNVKSYNIEDLSDFLQNLLSNWQDNVIQYGGQDL